MTAPQFANANRTDCRSSAPSPSADCGLPAVPPRQAGKFAPGPRRICAPPAGPHASAERHTRPGPSTGRPSRLLFLPRADRSSWRPGSRVPRRPAHATSGVGWAIQASAGGRGGGERQPAASCRQEHRLQTSTTRGQWSAAPAPLVSGWRTAATGSGVGDDGPASLLRALQLRNRRQPAGWAPLPRLAGAARSRSRHRCRPARAPGNGTRCSSSRCTCPAAQFNAP